ncbi:Endonuclease/Exonuclease/phosphatase family protein [Posidoniimonas polymericola]|uniref:Endonuclease/Exonuclease/phosphatase family protein n=1 Tax=Posidoniimonas polymericola TaxID=2528002 RepID=A0A5C5YPN2_9BACT|nr:endonuclease/exonuclease/phosphatase family protein [Posidoniimonas polymericola]TWT76833.1 Endonuclease/Exonuclease/phosphatase family protein [Posidoniimonas polymericola]
MIWIARLATAFVAAATLLPLLPLGAWYVRVCDFPRLQLAAGAVLPLLAVTLIPGMGNWFGERGLLATACLLVIAWQTSHVIPYTGLVRTEVAAPSEQDSDANRLRVVVANLDYENDQKDAMLAALQAESPDLLLLIECDQAWHDALAPLKERLPHECGKVQGEGVGLMLWSRLPLEEAEVRFLITERRPSIHTHVTLESGDRVRVVCVHPTPPGLQDSTGEDRRDSRVRDAELVVVANEMSQSGKEPCIVTGDFNDVAWSATTRLFKRLSGLQDPRVGRGLYNTYPARHALLRFPIDHVFLSPGFALEELRRLKLPGSDHFGVVAEVYAPATTDEQVEATPEEFEQAEEILQEGKEDAEERDIKSDEAEQHTLNRPADLPRPA